MKLRCPICESTEIIGRQYRGTSEDWDGVSEWNCAICGTRWGRWTKRVLQAGDIEPRYGEAKRIR